MRWTSILIVAGCGENHFARTDDWLRLDLEAHEEVVVHAVVQTEAEAWPSSVFSNAIRVGYYPNLNRDRLVERVRIAPLERRETRVFPGALNVLDAWDGCEVGSRCQRTVPLVVTCDSDSDCPGVLHAEAYLSTHRAGQAPAGTLRMRLRLP